MDLRLDPHAASLMAGELASDHASYLRGRVGRDPTSGELYAAHVLGPQGSAKLIEAVRANPSVTAATLFPEAAASNRGLFYRDGRAVSAGELYANLTSTPSAAAPAISSRRVGRAVAPPNDDSFMQYASARRIDRQEQEQAVIDWCCAAPEQSEDGGEPIAHRLAVLIRDAAGAVGCAPRAMSPASGHGQGLDRGRRVARRPRPVPGRRWRR